MLHVQRYGKMLHGQTLKLQRPIMTNVIAFRQISVAAHSWSYDNDSYFTTFNNVSIFTYFRAAFL